MIESFYYSSAFSSVGFYRSPIGSLQNDKTGAFLVQNEKSALIYGKILVFFRFDKKLQNSLFLYLAKTRKICYNNTHKEEIKERKRL